MPRLNAGQAFTIFLLLAPAMVALVVLAIRDAPMEPSQRLSIVAAVLLVAGVSAWITSSDERVDS